MGNTNIVGRLRATGTAIVPSADGKVLDPAEQQEDGDTECRRHDDGCKQLFTLELRCVLPQLLANARFALAEEEVADDGTDHREAGRDTQAGKDGRHSCGKHELSQPSRATGAVQGEEVVGAFFG